MLCYLSHLSDKVVDEPCASFQSLFVFMLERGSKDFSMKRQRQIYLKAENSQKGMFKSGCNDTFFW